MMNIGVFLSGVIGAVMAFWSFVSACLELHGLIVLKMNGPKKLSARSNVVQDAFMFLAQAIILLVGRSSFYTNPGPSPEELLPWLLVSLLLTGGLINDRFRRIKTAMLYDIANPPYGRRSTDQEPIQEA
jgi:hypothetical protein